MKSPLHIHWISVKYPLILHYPFINQSSIDYTSFFHGSQKPPCNIHQSCMALLANMVPPMLIVWFIINAFQIHPLKHNFGAIPMSDKAKSTLHPRWRWSNPYFWMAKSSFFSLVLDVFLKQSYDIPRFSGLNLRSPSILQPFNASWISYPGCQQDERRGRGWHYHGHCPGARHL